MENETQSHEGQPRRTFITGLVAAVSGVAALLSVPKRGQAKSVAPAAPAQGPILFRRTEESERYYKTLYR